MANSIVTVTISGSQIKYTVNIGAGDPLNWAVYVWSDKDHGQGQSTGHYYPYFVERITGSNTTTFYRTINTAQYFTANYVAELSLSGIGMVDYQLFVVPVICASVPSGISCPSSVPKNNTANFNVQWQSGGSLPPWYVEIYADSYNTWIGGTNALNTRGVMVPVQIKLPVGSHKIFADVWYVCSDGQTWKKSTTGQCTMNVTCPSFSTKLSMQGFQVNNSPAWLETDFYGGNPPYYVYWYFDNNTMIAKAEGVNNKYAWYGYFPNMPTGQHTMTSYAFYKCEDGSWPESIQSYTFSVQNSPPATCPTLSSWFGSCPTTPRRPGDTWNIVFDWWGGIAPYRISIYDQHGLSLEELGNIWDTHITIPLSYYDLHNITGNYSDTYVVVQDSCKNVNPQFSGQTCRTYEG